MNEVDHSQWSINQDVWMTGPTVPVHDGPTIGEKLEYLRLEETQAFPHHVTTHTLITVPDMGTPDRPVSSVIAIFPDRPDHSGAANAAHVMDALRVYELVKNGATWNTEAGNVCRTILYCTGLPAMRQLEEH